jgi:muconolactone delta-isomerase
MAIMEGPVADAIERVKADYIEMPGLSLTTGQMRRLWQFDAEICDAVVDVLVATEFLRRRRDSSYVRRQT